MFDPGLVGTDLALILVAHSEFRVPQLSLQLFDFIDLASESSIQSFYFLRKHADPILILCNFLVQISHTLQFPLEFFILLSQLSNSRLSLAVKLSYSGFVVGDFALVLRTNLLLHVP